MLLPLCSNAQSLEIEGKAKIKVMDLANTTDSVVVVLPDGTLAMRDVSTLLANQLLRISNDTVFLTKGGFVKLPTNTGDNLGDHIATQNIQLNGKYLSGDGQGEGVFVDTSGRVGIGTNAPKQTLHVNGDYYGKGHVWLHAYGGDSQSGTAYLQARDDSDTSTIEMRLRTQNAGSIIDVMTLKANGNVGIGTSVADSKLHVQGQIRMVDGNEGTGKVMVSDANGTASWADPTSSSTYAIGQMTQGGLVFYVDESGAHGLVADVTDVSVDMRWFAGTNGFTRAKGDGPFAGQMNTAIIISAQVSIGDDGNLYAASMCAQLEKGGYGDWYLPSVAELQLMYTNLKLPGLGGFEIDFYWSSEESDSGEARYVHFFQSSEGTHTKSETNRVRAVRAF